MNGHPCFDCRLPDCDDKAAGCNLRIVLRKTNAMRRLGQPIPPDLKQSASKAWTELYGPALLEARRKRKEEKANHVS